MAQEVTVVLQDDMDGSTGDDVALVEFALDGRTYEIDLSSENAEKLRAGLAPFVGAARRPSASSRGGPKRVRPGATDKEKLADIRTWARERGFTVRDKGRIPNEILNAYHAG